MPSHSTKAAAYYRMSTDRQESSVDRQRSQVIPYAEKHGYTIIGEYIDEGIAGDEIFKRKNFQRLLRDAQAGLFSAILCDDKDRFGRFDSIDAGEIMAPLRRKGVWIDTVVQGKIDWNSFQGRVTDAVLQEAKNMETDALSHRVLSNQLLAAQNGEFNGGRPTYGYRLEVGPARGKIYVPDGHKAEVVRFIFERYRDGATLGQIARELKERGIRSPAGNPEWSRTVLLSILRKRRYLGDATWGVRPTGKRHRHDGKGKIKTTDRGDKSAHCLPPGEWVIRENNHEPIIDRDLFDEVQAMLEKNKRRTTPHADGGPFVFSRLLTCGHCGAYMLGFTHNGNHVYTCGGYTRYGKGHCNLNTVKESVLLTLIVAKLREAFLEPANLERLRDEMRAQEEAAKNPENLGHLRKKADQLEKKVQAGLERLIDIPRELVKDTSALLARLKEEREQILKEIERAQTASPVKDLERQIADAEAILWSIGDALTKEDWPQLRGILRSMVEKIELFWTHVQRTQRTRSKLDHGIIYLPSQGSSDKLFVSTTRNEQLSIRIHFNAADLAAAG